MSAILSFQVEGEGSIVDIVDMLNMEFSDTPGLFEDRLRLIQDKDTPIGSGVPAYLGLEFEMKELTEEVLEDFRPIIALFRKLIEAHTKNKISAHVRFGDGEAARAFSI